jgi:hypothetical protein
MFSSENTRIHDTKRHRMNDGSLMRQFVLAARNYCNWVERGNTTNEALEALRLVSHLYGCAVTLSEEVKIDATQTERFSGISNEERKVILARFKHFPFQYYRDCFNPLDMESESSIGDIVDDFVDIYCDIKPGLFAFDGGFEPFAVFHWRHTWNNHWGQHAASALRCLHAYQAKID